MARRDVHRIDVSVPGSSLDPRSEPPSPPGVEIHRGPPLHPDHLLFFVEGSGEITMGEQTWDLRPGSYAKVQAGTHHALRNLSVGDMLILTVYDPPRERE